MGLATIADVLQARTAASQAQLNLQTIEGNLQTTRGALALSARPAGQSALRRGLDRGDRAGGVARRQRGRDHRPRARGSPRPRREPRRGRGRAGRHQRGAVGAAALARLQRHRGPHLRHHHPGRRQQLQPVARPHASRSSTASPASTIFARREFEAEAARGADRDAPATGGLPGLQRLLRAADRDPAGPHHPGPARQRDPVERGRARALQGRASARCSTCSRRRARSPAPGPSGWTRGSPGASRWPSWPTTPASSTPAARRSLRLTTDTTTVPPR